jgi:hypothetical protein
MPPAPPPRDDATQAAAQLAWQGQAATLRRLIGEGAFQACFATAQAQRILPDQRLLLAVPNRFIYDTIRRHYADAMSESAGLLEVVLVVDASLAPPATDATGAGMEAGAVLSPPLRGALARIFATRGFWSLHGERQLRLFEADDLEGRLQVIPSVRGANGVFEALVFTALFSVWANGARQEPIVEVSLRGLAEILNLSWHGELGAKFRHSVDLLKLTGYRFSLSDETGGEDDLFSLLDRVQTRWSGPPSSPYRRITAVFSQVAYALMQDRQTIRPFDLEVFAALGGQRQLARRLFLFLEAQSGGRGDDGIEIIQRLANARLAGTLGYDPTNRSFTRDLRRAGGAIVDCAPRYRSIGVRPRSKSYLRYGEARHLLYCTRRPRNA